MNIFGGIVDCTTIANGIVGACREIQMTLPLVVRLEGVCVCVRVCVCVCTCKLFFCAYVHAGTNSAKARQILSDSGLPIQPASDLADAANKVVASLS